MIAEQDRYLDAFLAKALNSDFSVDSVYWFETITKKINILKSIDDFISKSAFAETEALKNRASSEMMKDVGSSLILVLLLSLFIHFIAKSMSLHLKV